MIRRLAVLAATLCLGGAATAGEPPAYTGGQGASCRGSDGHAASFEGRRTFRWRGDWLAGVKARLGDPDIAPAYAALRARADAALAGPTYTVVDKLKTPPSGDKHDYMSMGPYWWADPSKPNGEPYVRRDGQVNPERNTNAFDVTDLGAMSSAVEALALASYFADDPRYAVKAATLLRVWFLDPATRMNPNATYAQGVPGVTPGRAEGVLDTARLLKVVEAIGLIGPAQVLSADEQKGLERWFADYLAWMGSSPTGLGEQAKTNNHGSWYDAQVAGFALFTRQDALARAVVARAGERRIAPQVATNGSPPQELDRPPPLNYSYYALEALVETAEYGRCVGLDLWRYQTADGRGLRTAIDYLAPYVGRESSFPYPDLKAEDASAAAYKLFRQAAWAYGDDGLARTGAIVAPQYPDHPSRLLIAPYGP